MPILVDACRPQTASRISHKAAVHPPVVGGVDASWRDSYDAAVFIAIFSRANYSIGMGVNANFCT